MENQSEYRTAIFAVQECTIRLLVEFPRHEKKIVPLMEHVTIDLESFYF